MNRKRQRSRDSENGPSPNPLQPSVGLNELHIEQQDQLFEATAPDQEVADSDWLQLVADDSNSNVVRSILMPLSSVDGETKADVVVDQVAAPSRRAVVWFRRDLRLHDNLALDAAIRMQQQTLKADEGEMALLPIYIVHQPVKQRCGPVRFQFLLEAVQDLADSIGKLQGRLLVLRGDAEEVLREVLPAWGITDLFFEAGVMPYAVARDERVRAIAAALDVTVATFRGVTLYDPHEIIRRNNGEPPTDYEQLLKITDDMQPPAHPIPAPEQLTNAARFTIEQLFAMLEQFCHHNPRLANSIAGIETSTCIKKASPELFVVPPLTAFGLTPPETHIFLYGGESEARRLLNAFSQDQQRVGLFEKPRTSPVTIDAPSTTSLSPYLVFGCLSAREFFNCIMVIQIQFPQRPGPTQVTLEGQLMWREFFYCYACGTPNFDSQERNPGCKQIKWRLRPENHEPCPEDGCERVSATDDADEKLAIHQLQRWKDGCTGFPWIDAVMRQINQEGWTHHAGRHAVACFLTRGILYISWLQGAMYFQEKLVDMDWALIVGNWLWVSASCFYSDYRRVASPSTFPQRWDKEGRFIRKYIPALRNMPDKFVFEPWKAPFTVLHNAGCLMGKDYPYPIVDLEYAVKRCITGMSHAYSDTESTTSETNTRANTDDPSSDESSPWSAGDMCYSYHTAVTDSEEVQAPQASSAPASSVERT
ncbi:hypothetical protein PRNP1_010851 [Phytophthora ramorum]